ncbi:MAG TPA: AI-2E family transporter [Terriglobia bacterium]|nr:AI-2E family transporter [Terriglobia bacterium]
MIEPSATLLLMIITGIVFYLCWMIVAPFVSALIWAFALCVALNPIRSRLMSRFHKTTVAAMMLASTIVIIVSIVYWVSQGLIQEALRGQQIVQNIVQPEGWAHLTESTPWLGLLWNRIQSEVDLDAMAKEGSAIIARGVAPAFGKSAVGISRAFLSMLFFDRMTLTVQTAIVGRLGIGVIQGMIGGILFWIVGIPAPLFWAIVMAILSTLPVFGAFVVWIPASVLLLASGHWVRAVILAAGGIALIHPVDNILYPLVIGPRVGLHPVILLIAFLGGVVAFGPHGIILGPLIATAAAVLAETWHTRTHQA